MGVIPAATARVSDSLRRLGWTFTPGQALARWPDEEPLAALVSAPGAGTARSRWTILARPERTVRCPAGHPAPLDALRAAIGQTAAPARPPAPAGLPFRAGWIGVLAYELGALLEPKARGGIVTPGALSPPAFELHRCPGAYVHDGISARWFGVGDATDLPDLSIPRRADGSFRVGTARSDIGRVAYESGVRRVIDYVRAGDVFQANLAHRLEAPFEGSPRAMFRALLGAAAPWYGAYVESVDETTGRRRAVCSISPELFLAYEPATRRVTTRPIKGTRRGEATRDELWASEKDAAELVMIVDLMRNDLGRVCIPGSVRVTEPRRIERHGGTAGPVQHGVATVEGLLRDQLDTPDLIAAAFPPGSITGAPKVRAMQIIGELEGRPRGVYCGAIGCFSDCGRMALNVAIRTPVVEGEPHGRPWRTKGVVSYAVGAGIVADSDPASEWHETLHKAVGFLRAVGSTFER